MVPFNVDASLFFFLSDDLLVEVGIKMMKLICVFNLSITLVVKLG